MMSKRVAEGLLKRRQRAVADPPQDRLREDDIQARHYAANPRYPKIWVPRPSAGSLKIKYVCDFIGVGD